MRISIDGLRDFSGLPEVERARFVATMMAFLSYSQNAFYKWQDGSLSDDLWVGWEALMSNLTGSPGGVEFWTERSYVFGDEFRTHVEQVIMKRPANSLAKPFGAFPLGRPN